ncbi:MAG: porin [archaeon]
MKRSELVKQEEKRKKNKHRSILCMISLTFFIFILFLSHEAIGESLKEERIISLEKQIKKQQEELEKLQENLSSIEAKNDTAVQAGWDDGFYISSKDNKSRLEVSGRIEPRYEYTRNRKQYRDGSTSIIPVEWHTIDELSSFDIRRARLYFKGHIGSKKLTYRLAPEFSGGSASLRDAWIDYEFYPALHIRAGQGTLPFQWHRSISSRRQFFVERSLVSRNFGYPKGRDLGVMIHGKNDLDTLYYGAGVYDGAGRNRGLSTSKGNVFTGRISYSPLGKLPREEPDLSHSENPQLALGIGVQTGLHNEIRDWDLGRSINDNNRADWVTGTADIRFAWKGLSIVADGSLRKVNPDDMEVSQYYGHGFSIATGYTIIPNKLGIVGRYSKIQLDRDVNETQETEWGLGVNLYHNKHDWKTQLQYIHHDKEETQTQSLILQHTFVF